MLVPLPFLHEDSICMDQTLPVENTYSCSFVSHDATEHGIPLACASCETNVSPLI